MPRRPVFRAAVASAFTLASALLMASALVVASTCPAAAHPHVWVAARLALRIAPDGRLAGIEQSWTFDREYSAFATLNLDPGHPGGPGPEALATLARTQLASLAEYRYFTRAKANGAEVAFGAPQEVRLTLADERLTLTFTLPPLDAAKLRIMTVTLDDESFFVAFNLGRDPASIRLSGAPKGCALNVRRPEADAQEGLQLIPDSEAAAADKAAAAGSDYLTRILVACP